jgi:hypothetical protein
MHRPTLCLLALVATLALAACGSSSSRTSTNASSTTPATTTGGGRFGNGKVAACLRQHGVALPNRPPGGRPRSGARRRGGFLFGGGPNASPAQRRKLQAAFQACGGRAGGFRRFNPGSNPAFKAALAKYVACVRKNGFDLPAPNTSGKGPVFDPSKVNRKDPKFVAASAKCQVLLQQGGPGGAPGGGAPPGA